MTDGWTIWPRLGDVQKIQDILSTYEHMNWAGFDPVFFRDWSDPLRALITTIGVSGNMDKDFFARLHDGMFLKKKNVT